MAFTVADAIEEARGLHPQFDDRQTPDQVLLAEMDNYQHELYDKMLEFDPDVFGTEQDIALPLADFDAGVTLNARHTDKGIEFRIGGTEQYQDGTIVPWRSRIRPGTGPSAYIVQDTLKLFGTVDDWTWADRLRFHYIALPTAFTALADTVALFPDRARQVFASYGARVMAARGPLDPQRPIPVAYFIGLHDARELQFLKSVSRKIKAKTYYWREAW